MLTLRGLPDLPHWAQWARSLRERDRESGEEKGSKGGEWRQGNLPKKQLPGKMTETPGLFRQGKGGEEAELGMEMEGNWNNQVLMCWGWQTFLPLLH